MPGRRPVSCFVIACCLVAGVVPFRTAHATTMQHLETRDLVVGSSEVVIGEVEGTRSYWNPAHTRILTDVSVRVSRALKGDPGTRLTLTQLGGEVDGVRVTVHGAPAFRAGEEALVFVWRDSKGRAQVNGLAQGKFEITRDPATGEARVERGAGFVTRDARTLATAAEGVSGAGPLRLAELVAEIERVLAKEAGR